MISLIKLRALACGILVAVMAAIPGYPQETSLKLPAEVAVFMENGTKAIALEKSDLNGDGQQDYVLVLEKEKPEMKDDFPINQRPLLILTRSTDGTLTVAKRNDRLVMCSQCGGVFGDPFEGVIAGRNTFTVDFYGGSNWRWKYSYKFNYSRLDKTWQLVRVYGASYHTSNPNKMETTIHTPPRHFSKIDIADFDPENYLKNGRNRTSN